MAFDGGGRLLRQKEKKSYQDNKLDDEIEGKRTFDVADKLQSPKFDLDINQFVRCDLDPKDFNLQYIQEHGFKEPLKFSTREGLDIRVPSDDFSVNDVKSFVGSRRAVDVVDTTTQEPLEMTMHQWARYYNTPDRDKILNVISLEFSHTGMEKLVEPPLLVRQIDWVNVMWPPHLIAEQKDSTNNIQDMKYPKIRKYVLMSVGGCYTDFHVDFGGTSVWYHILRGEKVFWLIPPTDENLNKYEKWVLSGKQQDIFFGDTVDRCCRVYLKEGDTFLIPSGFQILQRSQMIEYFVGKKIYDYVQACTGADEKFGHYTASGMPYDLSGLTRSSGWIHAVHTPCDSLVFGGNFIHSFSIPQQIRVNEIEDKTKVPYKFRFPFYAHLHWYAVKRYIDLLEKDLEEKEESEKMENGNKDDQQDKPPIKLTIRKGENSLEANEVKEESKPLLQNGVNGHSDIETDIADKPAVQPAKTKAWTPIYLSQSEIEGLQELIERLRYWPQAQKEYPTEIGDREELLDRLEELVELHANDDPKMASSGIHIFEQYDEFVDSTENRPVKIRLRSKPRSTDKPVIKKPKTPKTPKPSSGARKRRVRCGDCTGCLRDNCGKCKYCLDMPKFGGPGRMKQTCIYRICLNPRINAACELCGTKQKSNDNPIMECSKCGKIVHPECEIKGPCRISEELNNCWECPHCCKDENAEEFDPDRVMGKMDPLKRKLAESVGTLAPSQEAPASRKRKGSQRITKRAGTTRTTSSIIKSGQKDTEDGEGGKSRKRSRKRDSSDGEEDDEEGSESGEDEKEEDQSSEESEVEQEGTNDKKEQKGKKKDKKEKPPAPIIKEVDPLLVVRPLPIIPPPEEVSCEDDKPHVLPRKLWLKIYHNLSQKELCICMCVCKTWNRWALDSRFWNRIDVSNRRITQSMLEGIVRRQPLALNLDHTNITFRQLEWLLQRLPRLLKLSLDGNTSAAVTSLLFASCPPLRSLDISWCEGVRDDLLFDLLSPPSEGKSRLRHLRELRLSGCDVTDETIRNISRFLPYLETLDVSYCSKMTDAGVDVLTSETSICRDILREIDLSGCVRITNASLECLTQCALDPRVLVQRCDQLIATT